MPQVLLLVPEYDDPISVPKKKSLLTQHRIYQKYVIPKQSDYSFNHIQGRHKATFFAKELEKLLILKMLFGYR